MSLLSELKTIIEAQNISVETGVFNDTAPSRYAVLTPLMDRYGLFSDNLPSQDTEEVRISLFDKGNYRAAKRSLEKAILSAEIMVTGRRYIGHEDDTGYHHYAIDTAKTYEIKEEN